MPRQKEISWTQLRVGLMVGTSMVLLAVAIFFISGRIGFLSRRYTLKAYFSSGEGLRQGAVVDLAGIPVGNVKQFEISSSHDPKRAVEVVLEVARTYQGEIRADSVASIDTAGLLGESYVNVTRGSPSQPPIPAGGELKSREEADIKQVVQNANDVISNLRVLSATLNAITQQITSGQGSIGKLVYDQGFYNRLNRTTDSLETLATNLQQGKGTLGALLVDDTAYRKLNSTLDRANEIMQTLEGNKGSAGKFINDPEVYNRLEQVVNKANTILDGVNSGQGTLGKLVKDPQLYDRLNDTAGHIETVSSRMAKGEGSLGLLSTDTTLYKNLSESSQTLRDFLTEFRKNPRKFLTLHLRIF